MASHIHRAVRVGACGCVWVPVGACGCLWVPVGACGCVWVRVGACGCVWVRVGACGCVGVRVGVCGCVWVLGFGCMGVASRRHARGTTRTVMSGSLGTKEAGGRTRRATVYRVPAVTRSSCTVYSPRRALVP